MTEAKYKKTAFFVLLIFLIGAYFFLSSQLSVNFFVDFPQRFLKEFNANNNAEGSKLFEDKYFKRVLTAFKKKNELGINKKVFRQGDVPTFFLYTGNSVRIKGWKKQLRHIVSNECPFHCNVTENLTEISKVDAIVLYLKELKSRKFIEQLLPNRDPTQPWIMFTIETPKRANKIHADYKQFNSLFNRTMMYRKDADIIVNHGFVVSKEDSSYLPYHWNIPPETINLRSYDPNKTVIVAIISNCDKSGGRLDYIEELKKHINVDIYGKCGTLKCGHSLYVKHAYKPNTEKCLRKLGTSYMFYLAFENAVCTDYGTEKIYNLLYYPIVPIVYGGINYKEILPPNSYINIARYSPSELANYIKYLVSNPSEYEKYFKWKEYYTPSTIGGEIILCDLCTRLHDSKFYEFNLYEDFYKWFVTDSECDRKWTIDNKYNLSYKAILTRH